MNPPVPGMKTRPYGEEYMVGAWAGCVSWAIGEPDCQKAFKDATGHSLANLQPKNGLEAFLDWATENVWGLEGQEMLESEA